MLTRFRYGFATVRFGLMTSCELWDVCARRTSRGWALRGRHPERYDDAAFGAAVRRSRGVDRRCAEVLRLGRCAMCGASPRTEDVRLEVDHKIPMDWGGSPTDPDNLQPLCSECNRGKKAYFATFDEHGALIAAACAHSEVHRRIGEMLLAAAPDEVRADVLEMVANSGDQQDDWKKRTRELREIGWDYEIKKRTDSDGRRRSYYRLTRSASWPEEPIADAIRTAEKAKKTRR